MILSVQQWHLRVYCLSIQVAIIYIAIAMLGFFAAGGALQTGLAVVQLFNPGPKGRNTGIYYTFMGAASYLIPVVAAQLTKSSGEASAVYSLMIMLLVFAILAILSSLYLVAQHKKNLRKKCIIGSNIVTISIHTKKWTVVPKDVIIKKNAVLFLRLNC